MTYPNTAINQLMRTTLGWGSDLNFSRQHQAKVMKRFDAPSMRIGSNRGYGEPSIGDAPSSGG